jgi:predicted short-subunit dehydrogenase-like oxidoreductase (DUF2520 family)
MTLCRFRVWRHPPLEVPDLHKVMIYGPGRIGTALALALQAAHYDVIGAWSRDIANSSAQRFAHLTQCPVFPINDWAHLQTAHIVLVTVPDKAVTHTAQTLAQTGLLSPDTLVIHTSGALSSTALWPIEPTGAKKLSLHPLQTIADPVAWPVLLKGAYCALEGDPEGIVIGREMVASWKGTVLELRPEDKPTYHAAAVLASNALAALVGIAADLLPTPDALTALLPLVKGAVANLEQLGWPNALTGPIERGDVQTVSTHLQALQSNPTALHVYTALGAATASFAQQKGSLSVEQMRHFLSLLDGNQPTSQTGEKDSPAQELG